VGQQEETVGDHSRQAMPLFVRRADFPQLHVLPAAAPSCCRLQ
jgi:hypothetical protein